VVVVAAALAFCWFRAGVEAQTSTVHTTNQAITLKWTPDGDAPNRYYVEALGIDLPSLQLLRDLPASKLAELLSIHTEQDSVIKEIGKPAMAGDYSVEERCIRFTPKFALVPGVNYRALLRSDRLPGVQTSNLDFITARFMVPVPQRESSTRVLTVYPSSRLLPENLLKFYIQFSAPMSRGRIYQYIHLLDESGEPVELPFLELDEELWSPDMTRLTLFIDPGRIKREVKPLEDIGPALQEGKHFTLGIDREWSDGRGDRLEAAYARSFRVVAPDRTPPDPQKWIVHPPVSNDRGLLMVDFGEAMDHALALRMIKVVDPESGTLSGTSSLADEERRWLFTPDLPWASGDYAIVVQTTIEDLAGNNIGKPFEVDLFEGVQRGLTHEFVRIAFRVE